MLESIIQLVSSYAQASAAAGHTSQTAIAAVLCAILIGCFS